MTDNVLISLLIIGASLVCAAVRILVLKGKQIEGDGRGAVALRQALLGWEGVGNPWIFLVLSMVGVGFGILKVGVMGIPYEVWGGLGLGNALVWLVPLRWVAQEERKVKSQEGWAVAVASLILIVLMIMVSSTLHG